MIVMLVNEEVKLPDNKSKSFNKRKNSIFSKAFKFRFTSSWEAKLTCYDQWNAEKTKSTHMIKFSQSVLKESICLLQDTDFIVFYFTIELLKCIMHNYKNSTYQILIWLIKIPDEKYKLQYKYLPDAYIEYLNQLIKSVEEAQEVEKQDHSNERISQEIRMEVEIQTKLTLT